jgi:hypothetical protein
VRRLPDPELPARLTGLRRDHYGEHGGPMLAMMLGVSFREWAGYEAAKPVPAGILSRLSEVTGVEMDWLRTGGGEVGEVDRSRTSLTLGEDLRWI